MKGAAEPTISVVIPCYNHAHYLPQAIDSVLAQSHPAAEIIVVDDGSTDDTAQVAARYGDRIRYVYRENGGLSAARNTGIGVSTGALLHFLDADDYIDPDMYARVAEAAARTPGAGCFNTAWRAVDRNGQLLGTFDAYTLPDDALATLLRANRFPPCAGMVRRETLDRVGDFKLSLRSCEDWDLWIRCAAAGARFEPVPGAVALYRRYEGSMSTNHRRMWLSGLQVLRDAARLPGLPADAARHLRAGKRHWRGFCFKRLIQGIRGLSPAARARSLAAAVWMDPALVASLASFGIRSAVRSSTGAKRLADAPATQP